MRAALFFSLVSHSKLTDFHKYSVINLLQQLNYIYCKEIGKNKILKNWKKEIKSNRLAKRAPLELINLQHAGILKKTEVFSFLSERLKKGRQEPQFFHYWKNKFQVGCKFIIWLLNSRGISSDQKTVVAVLRHQCL